MPNFNELTLSREVLMAIADMGFEEMTPIQAAAIPLALEGRDVLGQAQTGTGKTAAFGIPMMERIRMDVEQVQALVLAPTRELAMQVAEELNRLGAVKGVRSLPVYGGQEIERQIRAIKARPHIVVATPGRLLDHLRRRTLRIGQVSFVVLDEADEMLNMGFIEDIESILAETPGERQTMLFSATMPMPIQNLAMKFMREAVKATVPVRELTVPTTEQHYIEVRESQKFDVLCLLLDTASPGLSIVFGRTKRRVDEVSEALAKRGYAALGIHGDLTQARRDQVMRKFRDGSIDVLVATDVAARGLDIEGVSHIYNFDIPQDAEGYVHRIGRTGRAGRTGQATTLVTPREFDLMRLIERMTGRKVQRRPSPTFSEAIEGQRRLSMDKLLQVVEEGNIEHYKGAAEALLAKADSTSLIAAALKFMTKEPDATPVLLTEAAPLRRPRSESRPFSRPRSDTGGRDRRQSDRRSRQNWDARR
ncbi:MAG: DEAD-box ATP-dependent RNA helicase CshA [Firmicutes bacterium]|nr:DEAD-box ATP-dependent RNA helicase CshA [Bacillota bacterium]